MLCCCVMSAAERALAHSSLLCPGAGAGAAVAVNAGDLSTVTCHTLADLADYADPMAAGALAKCVLLVMGVVTLDASKGTLQQQIQAVSIHLNTQLSN